MTFQPLIRLDDTQETFPKEDDDGGGESNGAADEGGGEEEEDLFAEAKDSQETRSTGKALKGQGTGDMLV